MCCSSWDGKESDTTERLNSTEYNTCPPCSSLPDPQPLRSTDLFTVCMVLHLPACHRVESCSMQPFQIGLFHVCVCVFCLATQVFLTLCDPMDCSPPGSSVHGILQARILQWVAISFSRASFPPRNQTWVSCIAGRFFTKLSFEGIPKHKNEEN